MNPVPGFPVDIEVHDFEVLDIDFDKGVAGFKLTYVAPKLYSEGDGPPTETYLCSYPGMRDRAAGTLLGVYDLKKDTVQKFFHVYKSVYSKKDCSKESESKKTLAAAKTYFSNLGLGSESESFEKRGITEHWNTDFRRGLRPSSNQYESKIYFERNPKGPRTFWMESGRLEVDQKPKDTAEAAAKKLLEGREDIDFTLGKIKTRKLLKDSDGSWKEDLSSTSTIWSRLQQDSFSMASGGSFLLPRAYSKDNKIVFLEWFYHYNHHAGSVDSNLISFSPVITLD